MVKFVGEDLDINRALRVLTPRVFKNLSLKDQLYLVGAGLTIAIVSWLSFPYIASNVGVGLAKLAEPFIGELLSAVVSTVTSLSLALTAGFTVAHIPAMKNVYDRSVRKEKLRGEIRELAQELPEPRQKVINDHIEHMKTNKEEYNKHRNQQEIRLQNFKKDLQAEVALRKEIKAMAKQLPGEEAIEMYLANMVDSKDDRDKFKYSQTQQLKYYKSGLESGLDSRASQNGSGVTNNWRERVQAALTPSRATHVERYRSRLEIPRPGYGYI